jgi:hypothetical protein
MYNRKITKIIFIGLLAWFTMACSLTKLAQNGSDKIENEPRVVRSQPSEIKLGEEFISEEGGFAFRKIPDYSIEGYFGFVYMNAPDADPEEGPFVVFIGEVHEKDITLNMVFQKASSDFDDQVEVINQQELKIGSASARSMEVSGHSDDGNPMKGRMVVIQISPRHTVTSFATAPSDRWDNELEGAYDAVLKSLRFFDPVEISIEFPDPEPMSNEVILHQWAVYAEATSSYDDPDWGAMQMTGPPDTFICDDLPTAWASEKKDTIDRLVLYYEQPVIPLGVYIHQTHAPNQIVEVVLVDIFDNDHLIYKNDPWNEPECPYVLEIAGFEIDTPVDMILIFIDQSILGTSWNEIDAVELVGIHSGEAPNSDTPVAEMPRIEDSAFSNRYQIFPEMYQELDRIDLGESTYYVLWESMEEDGDYDDVHTGGSRQDQSTSSEYVIGMIGKNNRPSVSLFLPVDQKSGAYDLKTYNSGDPVKGPTVAMYIGIWLYIAQEGRMEIEVSADGKVSGKILAYLVSKDDPSKDAAVVIRLKNLPLK